MNLENLLNDIIEEFNKTGLVLDPKASFRDLDSWDSLTGMAIIVMIKDKYSVEISDEEFKNLISLQDIFDLVQKKYMQ